MKVRRARVDEAQPISAVLARAFASNPFVRWIVPDDAHYREAGEGFFRLGVEIDLHEGEVFTTDDYAGAALWLPPGVGGPGVLQQLSLGVSLLRILGRRTFVGVTALNRFEAERPSCPHWYLTILGTDPARQGLGIGSQLIAPILARCDETGVPAYLESSDPDNVGYYHRFGFKVTGEIAFRGGPTVPLMLREPGG